MCVFISLSACFVWLGRLLLHISISRTKVMQFIETVFNFHFKMVHMSAVNRGSGSIMRTPQKAGTDLKTHASRAPFETSRLNYVHAFKLAQSKSRSKALLGICGETFTFVSTMLSCHSDWVWQVLWKKELPNFFQCLHELHKLVKKKNPSSKKKKKSCSCKSSSRWFSMKGEVCWIQTHDNVLKVLLVKQMKTNSISLSFHVAVWLYVGLSRKISIKWTKTSGWYILTFERLSFSFLFFFFLEWHAAAKKHTITLLSDKHWGQQNNFKISVISYWVHVHPVLTTLGFVLVSVKFGSESRCGWISSNMYDYTNIITVQIFKKINHLI